MARLDVLTSIVLGVLLVGCSPSGEGSNDEGASGSGTAASRTSGSSAGDQGSITTGGATTNGVTTGGGEGGGVGGLGGDPGTEGEARQCLVCLDVNEDMCAAEVAACKASLACQQLFDCPESCGLTAECAAQCNEIIPTGVELLTAAVECMVCNGGPCAADCTSGSLLSYCG